MSSPPDSNPPAYAPVDGPMQFQVNVHRARSCSCCGRMLTQVIIAFGLMALACGLARLAAGATLGLPLGIVFCIVILQPALTAAGHSRPDRLYALGGGLLAACLMLLITGWGGGGTSAVMSLLQWLTCAGILLALGLSLAGAVELLLRLKFGRSFSAWITLLIGLLWLLWPVWLGPFLASDHLTAPQAQSLVSWLTPAHPLLATNGVLIHRGVWSEQSGVAYRLTNLAQDIPYAMPSGATACIAMHMAIAMILWALAIVPIRPPANRAPAPATSPPDSER